MIYNNQRNQSYNRLSQRGATFIISLIVLVILVFIGTSLANNGIISAQIVRYHNRYNEVSAIAEGELIQTIQNTPLTEGVSQNTYTKNNGSSNGKIITQTTITQLSRKAITNSTASTITKQYHIKVKAFAQNNNDTADKERQTVVVQTIYQQQ